MSAPVSVIVPTLNAVAGIGPCLAALGEGLTAGLIAELIIADGGSEDGIGTVAEEIGARLVTAPPGRGTQLAAGCAAARAPWLLVLHADTVLAPGWAEAARTHLEGGPGRAGHFRLAFDSPAVMARVTERWANLRSALFALPYGDQGLLVHRELYEAAGGYPRVPLMEDVILARRLGRARLAAIPATATTSAARYEAEGWVRRGARNLATLALFLAGVPPERLAGRYRRSARRSGVRRDGTAPRRR